MTKKEHWIRAKGCVYNVNYHFVWSTKYRRMVLVGGVPDDLHMLHELIAEQKDMTLITQEIMDERSRIPPTLVGGGMRSNLCKLT